MQGLQIEAVYEKGTLKLPRELPLVEGATVTITIHPPGRPGVIKHVHIPWQGDHEEFDRWLNDPDEGQWGSVTFDNLLSGSAVFIDANCLVFAFDSQSPHNTACRRLLDRIENGDLQGFTSAHVLSEMSHRLMTLEAIALFNRPLAGIANWLRRHPTEVQQLSRYRQAIDELGLIQLTVLPVSGANVSRAADFSRQHGLLTNDALILAVMQAQGLTALASLDADFDRVPGLTRYAPA